MDCQAPLSLGFSRQEYWRGLLCPPPGDLSNPCIKPTSLMSPALSGGFFITSATWEAFIVPALTQMPPHTSLPWSLFFFFVLLFLRMDLPCFFFLFSFLVFLNFILFLNFTILYWFCQISNWKRHVYPNDLFWKAVSHFNSLLNFSTWISALPSNPIPTDPYHFTDISLMKFTTFRLYNLLFLFDLPDETVRSLKSESIFSYSYALNKLIITSCIE